MIGSHFSFEFLSRRIFAAVLGLVVVLTSFVGCASSDMITFSRDAQRKGINLYNEGSYAEAAGAFRHAARQNPRDYRNYYYMGACYEQMTQHQQAIHAYRTARDIINVSMAGKEDDEFRLRIINGLGRSIARSDGRDLETNATVSEAESTSNPESWFVVAKIHAFRGDADSAIDAYNRAALLAPKNAMILKDYGLYLEQVGQPQQAITPLRRAYALNTNDAQVAEALRRLGVVPGPSIKPETALVQPPLPKGPIPELELTFLKRGNSSGSSSANAGATGPTASTPNTTVEAPRD